MVSGKRQHLRTLLLCCVVCTGLVLALHIGVDRYRDWEWKARDQLAYHGRKAVSAPQLTFLAIDNRSLIQDDINPQDREASPALKMMQKGWPFPRAIYPLIIERLMDAGARAVCFDILFTTPQGELDEPLRQVLEKYADRLVIGANVEPRDQGHMENSARLRLALAPPAETLIPPVAGVDSRLGFVNFWPDIDLVVRRAYYRSTILELNGEGPMADAETIYSLAARTLQKAGLESRLPATHEPRMFRFSDIRALSLQEIFVPQRWTDATLQSGAYFRDKIVFIGPDGNWVKDELQTPHGLMIGPRVHLSALNAALQGDFLTETTPWSNIAIIVSSGLAAMLLGWLVPRPLPRFLLLVSGAAGYYLAAQGLFNSVGLFPIVLSPLLSLVGAGTSFSVVEWALDRREKTRIRRTLERYVSKDVVKEVLDNPESFLNSLNGERRPATILFSDVRGFTTVTESADPTALVSQLNEYFREMVKIVRIEQRGTLDKFIGDAVMAHWGSIVTEGKETDARCAVATALRMREVLARLNADWEVRGMHHFSIGIGVNHGEVIVANLGSDEKMEVSVIGDAVNLASRLEGVTKPYHVDICIGESVATLVGDAFILRSLDLIKVKGKTRPVATFTVLGERNGSGTDPGWLPAHEEATRRYRHGDFAAAEVGFCEVLRQYAGDGVSELMIARCRALQARPPEGQWTGVYEMTDK